MCFSFTDKIIVNQCIFFFRVHVPICVLFLNDNCWDHNLRVLQQPFVFPVLSMEYWHYWQLFLIIISISSITIFIAIILLSICFLLFPSLIILDFFSVVLQELLLCISQVIIKLYVSCFRLLNHKLSVFTCFSL